MNDPGRLWFMVVGVVYDAWNTGRNSETGGSRRNGGETLTLYGYYGVFWEPRPLFCERRLGTGVMSLIRGSFGRCS